MAESCIGPQTNCKPLTYQTALPKKPTFQVIRILRYRKFKISKAHIYTREHSISQESGDLIGKSRLSHTPSYQHTAAAAAAAVVHQQKLQPGFFTFFFTSLHFTSRRPSGPSNEKTNNHPVNCIAIPIPNPPPPVRNFGY